MSAYEVAMLSSYKNCDGWGILKQQVLNIAVTF